MSVNLKIKASTGDTFDIVGEPEKTIFELKKSIQQSGKCNVPAEQQRLIYKGQVLKDEELLKTYKPIEGGCIHLVKGRALNTSEPSTTSSEPATTTTPAPASTPAPAPPVNTTPSNPVPNPMAAFAALGGANRNTFGAGGLPSGLTALMDNPLIQNMLSNPEVMRELMMNNPAMRQVMERNPELGQVLQDPQTLRQAMEVMRNPALMQEMTRNTDLALSNLDSVPGGMDALARMYNEVQRPLEEAREESLGNAGITPTGGSTTAPSTGPPNTAPLPNPWSRGSGPTTANAGADPLLQAMQSPLMQQMTANLLSGGAGAGAAGGAAGAGAGLGAGLGAGGAGGAGGLNYANLLQGMDPNLLSQTMQSPMFQQMMSGMMANQGAGGLPGLAGMDPAIIMQTMQSPLFQQMATQMMSNPQVMQQLMQSMGNLNMGGAAGLGGLGGLGAMGDLFNNPMATGLSGNVGAQNTLPPEQRYATQLTQLREMGFTDDNASLRALQAVGGNVSLALDRLMGIM